MTTTETSEQHVTAAMTANPNNSFKCNEEPFDLDRRRVFNTGPCSSFGMQKKTYVDPTLPVVSKFVHQTPMCDRSPSDEPTRTPTASNTSTISNENINLYATCEYMPSRTPPTPRQYHHQTGGPHATPPNHSNDSSNLSGTGSAGSEPDKDPPMIIPPCPGFSPAALPAESAKLPTPVNNITPAPTRKRKQGEPRHVQPKKMERKLTEYLKIEKNLLKQNNAPVQQNGDANDDLKSGKIPFRKRSHSQDSREPAESECKVESTTETPSAFDSTAQLKRLHEEVNRLSSELQKEKHKTGAYKEVIRLLLIEKSKAKRKEARERNLEGQLRIGQFKPTRVGEHFKDQWTDGYAMEEINTKIEKLNQEKNEIQNASTNLRKKKGTKESKKAAAEPASPSVSSSNPLLSINDSSTTTSRLSFTDDGFLRPEPPKEMTSQEIYEQEEILKLRREHLKREETEMLTEKDRLERERNLHIREMKRIQCEEQSRFKDHTLLHDRYLLMSLLGKGGFSEVWRAYDLDENRYVACKIHHVNKEWKEDKKANYVKHAMREKDIHKSLNHPRIVRLYDLFTIDNDSFCTVLQYCDGNDLDFYLKQHKQIPEKEARSIIMQVVSALKYLNERKHPVIHYDLKPANILLQSGTAGGEIKITDFGLSKTIESSEDGDSIELTSQGAGTYWYLPPETFQSFNHGGPPKISSKVDVWSVGVIFYQCLYGKRPFGHERTQQQILQEKTILNASEVAFPSYPKISAAAQDFIRACLQYNKDERADVAQLASHELFKPRQNRTTL